MSIFMVDLDYSLDNGDLTAEKGLLRFRSSLGFCINPLSLHLVQQKKYISYETYHVLIKIRVYP